jgi:hypothetical protein
VALVLGVEGAHLALAVGLDLLVPGLQAVGERLALGGIAAGRSLSAGVGPGRAQAGPPGGCAPAVPAAKIIAAAKPPPLMPAPVFAPSVTRAARDSA